MSENAWWIIYCAGAVATFFWFLLEARKPSMQSMGGVSGCPPEVMALVAGLVWPLVFAMLVVGVMVEAVLRELR